MAPDSQLLQTYRDQRKQHQQGSSPAALLEPYACEGDFLEKVRGELEEQVQPPSRRSLDYLKSSWGLEIEDLFYLFDGMYKSLRFLNLVRKIFTQLQSKEAGLTVLLQTKGNSDEPQWRPKTAEIALNSVTSASASTEKVLGHGEDDHEGLNDDEVHAEDDDERSSCDQDTSSPLADRSFGRRSSISNSHKGDFTPSGQPKRRRSGNSGVYDRKGKKSRVSGFPRISVTASDSVEVYTPAARRRTTGRAARTARTQGEQYRHRSSLAGSGAYVEKAQSASVARESVARDETAEDDPKLAPWDLFPGGSTLSRPVYSPTADAADEGIADTWIGQVPATEDGLHGGPLRMSPDILPPAVGHDDLLLGDASSASDATPASRPTSIGSLHSAFDTGLLRQAALGREQNATHKASVSGNEPWAASLDGISRGDAGKQTKSAATRRRETGTEGYLERFSASQPSGAITQTASTSSMSGTGPGYETDVGADSDKLKDLQNETSRERLLSNQWLDENCVRQVVLAFNPEPRKWYVADPLVLEGRNEIVSANELRRCSQQRKALVPVRSREHWNLAYLDRSERTCTVYHSHACQTQAERTRNAVEAVLREMDIFHGSVTLASDPEQILSQTNANDSGMYVILHALHLMHQLPMRDLRPQTWRRRLLPLFDSEPFQPTAAGGCGDTLDDMLESLRNRSWEENATLLSVAQQQAERLDHLRKEQADAREVETWLQRAPMSNLMMDELMQRACHEQSAELSDILEHAPQIEQAMIRIRRLLHDCFAIHNQQMCEYRRVRATIDNNLAQMDAARIAAGKSMEALATTLSEDISTALETPS